MKQLLMKKLTDTWEFYFTYMYIAIIIIHVILQTIVTSCLFLNKKGDNNNVILIMTVPSQYHLPDLVSFPISGSLFVF